MSDGAHGVAKRPVLLYTQLSSAPSLDSSSCPPACPETTELPDEIELPPSLYMTHAAKHPRLHTLILAGRRHLFLQRMLERSSLPPATHPIAGSAYKYVLLIGFPVYMLLT